MSFAEGVLDVTRFIGAARDGNLQEVDRFLSNGISLNIQDKHGATALHYVVQGNQLSVISHLLTSGARILGDNTGWTPAHCAVAGGFQQALMLLLQHDAAVIHAVDQDNWSLAHAAAMNHDLQMLFFLRQRGANFALVTHEEKYNILHVAASEGCLDICTLILRDFSSLHLEHAEDIYGRTPYDCAQSRAHSAVMRLFSQSSEKPEKREGRVGPPATSAVTEAADTVIVIESIETPSGTWLSYLFMGMQRIATGVLGFFFEAEVPEATAESPSLPATRVEVARPSPQIIQEQQATGALSSEAPSERVGLKNRRGLTQ